MGTMVRAARWAAAGAMALAIACASSWGVEFGDIAGTWCTEAGRIQFDRTTMVVVLSSGQRLEYSIIRYDFAPAEVDIWWRNDKGEETYTKYGDFGANATMVQMSVERKDGTMTARRNLRRC